MAVVAADPHVVDLDGGDDVLSIASWGLSDELEQIIDVETSIMEQREDEPMDQSCPDRWGWAMSIVCSARSTFYYQCASPSGVNTPSLAQSTVTVRTAPAVSALCPRPAC
eukprot:12983294-Alexandrium_andersonii.AAC.1